MSSPGGTLRSSAKVSLAVLASRVLGVVRDSLFAAIFGVSKLTDAYYTAFRIPNLLRDLFAEGALSSAFVPTFSQALADGGRERAYRLGNLVLGGLVVITGFLTLVGVVFAEPIVWLISRGFVGDAEKLAYATLFARIMMPILALVSVSATWMGMLNAQQRYLAPAYAPAMFNVTSIVVGVIVFASGWGERQAILVWTAGTTLSGLVQMLVQLPPLLRLGYRPRIAVRGLFADAAVVRIAKLMAPATIGLAAVQLNVFVNTQFAATLGDGPQTHLNNAFRLFYLPIGLFGVALATVTTARASAEAARGDRTALIERVAEGARGVWMLALPSAVGLIVLAHPIVQLLYERRAFTPAYTAATVPIVQAYMLGVLPYSLVKVYAPAFFAVGRPRVPMLASIGAVAVNIVFNGLTYRVLGAPGLALGTTLSALVNVMVLRLAFARIVGRPAPRAWAGDLARMAAANGLLGVTAWAAWQGSQRLVAASGPLLGTGLAYGLWVASLFATIGAGFVLYVQTLRLLRFAGADELWEMPRRLLGKLRGR